MLNPRRKIRRITLESLFVALIILQTSVPFLGNIPLGVLDITIIHVTVIVAAILFGVKEGMVIGGIWGGITFIRAFIWPTSPLAVICFTNPIVSVLPRILIGLVAGEIYIFLKRHCARRLAMMIAAAAGSLTNTVLVLGFIYLFYHQQAHALYMISVHQLLPYLMTVVVTNGIPEMLVAIICVPLIVNALEKAMHVTTV